MKNITVKIEDKAELIGFLKTIGTECRFITMDTETMVENMPKTNNPYWGTIKLCKRNGFVNADFVTAVEKRYAEMNGLSPADVTYTPGKVWYHHVMTDDNKPLCLCESNNPNKKTGVVGKYLQFFPLRNLGETTYIHPTLGKLSTKQIKEMEDRFYANNSPAWKPRVITLSIDSIRSISFRRIKMLNDTVSRLTGRLAKWNKVVVDTKPVEATPMVAA
jgi:hypothetical protein